ncbi:MAG: hypothetical protein GXO79_12460 [Chlorobi bacterium]|nr:hypothetical protein [Chlorobiota bacterium]
MKGGNFLLKNLLKGFIWLLAIVAIFIYVKEKVDVDYYAWLKPLSSRLGLIYLIFIISEVIFGIIPPELFMIWAATKFTFTGFVFQIFFLSALSYLAGILGYWIGAFLNRSLFFRVSKKRILGKYDKYLFKYGEFLVVVAAVTPIPFSGISMLVGSLKLPFNKYLLFALTRFLRFFIYAYIVWQANILY